jgi:hypothetical protein
MAGPELLSTCFGVCAETTYVLQISRHVFDPRKRHEFSGHRKDMHLRQRSEFDICAIVNAINRGASEDKDRMGSRPSRQRADLHPAIQNEGFAFSMGSFKRRISAN